MYLKTEGGQQWISELLQGLWRLRGHERLAEPLFPPLPPAAIPAAEARKRRQEKSKRRKEKTMRRLREEQEVVPLRFDGPDEIRNLCARLEEFLKRGKGAGGADLTYQEASDYFHELLDATQREPTAEDEALEEAFGIRTPVRRRGGLSNVRFLDAHEAINLLASPI
jgi:hypothetical protein